MPPNKLGQTHGYIRGWVKTDTEGKYYIYTVRPGTYPTNDEPAHIHITVKEPNDIKEYYIDDFVFDDDKLLTSSKRQKMENRCGSGILRLVQKGDLQIGERNLILGLNIPDFPNKPVRELNSGNKVGEEVFHLPLFTLGVLTREQKLVLYANMVGIMVFYILLETIQIGLKLING